MSTAFGILAAVPLLMVMVAALVMIVGFIITTFVSLGESIVVWAREHRSHRTTGSAPSIFHEPLPHF